MTKNQLNEIITDLVAAWKMRKDSLVAIHEAGLVALGIDSNGIPYGLDFLVLDDMPDNRSDGSHNSFSFDGFTVRFHTAENLEIDGRPVLVLPSGMDYPTLEPETLLEFLPKSADFDNLLEQRAALAELLYFDKMYDDELREFGAYVRF